MTPQKKIRVGAGFVAIWVLLGGAWLCDYFFGGTEFWKLASGELTVLLGIGRRDWRCSGKGAAGRRQ